MKRLRRIEVGDARYATRDESTGYADLLPDGSQRQYTSIQEAKSVITSPSGGQSLLEKGYCNGTALAWSGRGRIQRVDVSFDGGRNRQTARLDSLVLPKALTRFSIGWVWQGEPAILRSRCIDETGFVLPSSVRQIGADAGHGLRPLPSLRDCGLTEEQDARHERIEALSGARIAAARSLRRHSAA